MSEDVAALIEHGKLPSRISLHCALPTGCGTLTRVYRVEPTTEIGALQYCPKCGQKVLGHLSSEESGWESLAVAYNMSVPAIKAVYAGWNPHEYYRFSDYVQALREEARTGIAQPTKPMPHESITLPPPIPAPPMPKMKVPTRV